LSIKNPFQQQPGTRGGRDAGKDYFNKDYYSDHVTSIQAYYEWRQAVKGGSGDDFCEAKGLSPEVLDMAHMMINQFLNFMLDAGYNGADVDADAGGDIMEMQPFKRNSPEHYALNCALAGGFYPSACVLYNNGRSPAYWYTMGGETVSAFRGSCNSDYVMQKRDGDEWMVYSDSMKMGPHNSIMDSTLVQSNYILLFCNQLFVDRVKKTVRFDKWKADVDHLGDFDEVLKLRKEIMPMIRESIASRDLSVFPESLTQRMIKFVTGRVISLKNIDAVKTKIYDELPENMWDQLSHFEWPQDDGPGSDEEDEEMEG